MNENPATPSAAPQPASPDVAPDVPATAAPSATAGHASRMARHLLEHPVEHPAFDQFVATIAALRAPDGCPWDREQTHASIAHNMIEEAYEAMDAIESADVPHLREELGDVLLQVVLQSQIASDAGEFTIDDVCADVNAKMVRRHPHVFGEATAENANDVLGLWDQVKLAERRSAEGTGERTSEGADEGSGTQARQAGLLDGVPRSFPALMGAQKVSRKAAAVGFEWDTLDDVWSKVAEEVAELHEAYAAAPKTPDGKLVKDDAAASASRGATAGTEGDAASASSVTSGLAAAVEMELGDVLFALTNVARRMGVDAESALRASTAKFRERWSFIEGAAEAQGRAVEDLAMAEMEALWKQAKARE